MKRISTVFAILLGACSSSPGFTTARTTALAPPTSQDIAHWQGTVDGPENIVAVLLANDYDVSLRAEAGLALIEMERDDEDGIQLLQGAIERIASRDEAPLREIVAGMAPGLLGLMEGPAGQLSENPDRPEQVRAQNAAYLLIAHANDETRPPLIDGVVGWYLEEFVARSESGRHSFEQVVRSLGAPAARRLLDAISYQMPPQGLVQVAELIGHVGDDETKQRAATRLVEVEMAMESQEFIDWLKSKIAEALASQGSDDSDARVTNIALVNQDIFINSAIDAMKHLASFAAVRDRLMTIAVTAPTGDMTADSQALLNTRRQRALMALEGNATEAHLSQLLDLALNPPLLVQDYAFDRIGEIGSPEAIPRLWPLVENASADQKRLRWRAGEMVLLLGGSDILDQFFTRLPDERRTEYPPQELVGYAVQLSQMTPPVDLIERELSARQWHRRVIALHSIALSGTAADIARMQRLVSDRARVVGEGWEARGIRTVGNIAEAAIASLRERLGVR